MAKNIIELVVGDLGQKKQYRRNQARLNALPAPYAKAAKAVQHYLMYAGGLVEGETLVRMQTDFVDLWERAAADGIPVRDVVGSDPVGFADDFVAAYSGRTWKDKERAKLTAAVDEAVAEQTREADG